MNLSKSNRSGMFCIELKAALAMFTTPLSKEACEHISYPFPTYSAVQGMFNRIYNKPGIIWIPHRIRVMNPIEYDNRSQATPCYELKKNKYKLQRFRYAYLKDVRYQIEAYYVIDMRYVGTKYANLNHDNSIRNRINIGCDLVWAGTSQCYAEVYPGIWGKDEGYYDNSGEGEPIYMFHHFKYDRRQNGKIVGTCYCMPKMIDGIVSFDGLAYSEYRGWK